MICAVSLVGQGLDEAKSKLDGSLELYMYHGSSRRRDAHYLAEIYDLVVTTYQVLLSLHLQAAGRPSARPHDGTDTWRCMLDAKCLASRMSFPSDAALHQVKAELRLSDHR